MNELEQKLLSAYNQYADAIFRHCYFRVSDKGKAEDIMQETFMKTWQQIVRGEDIREMRAFLYRVANNLIIDHYRKKKDESLDLLQEDGFEPTSDDWKSIEAGVFGREITELLSRLGDSDRELIVMRYIDDLPVKEIARIIEKSENVISVRIYRALKKLHQFSNE